MENKDKLIRIKWESNWADEMDISGFVISSEEEYNRWKKILMRKSDFSIGLGTNEENYYESGKDLLDECSIKEITEEESELLIKILSDDGDFEVEDDDEEYDDWDDWGCFGYGFTQFWDTIWDDEEDELDSDI